MEVVKSRRVRWTGHVARVGEMKNAYKILVGKSEGKERSETIDVDGRIMLEWILGKWSGRVCTADI
jgi:hypothetical protein